MNIRSALAAATAVRWQVAKAGVAVVAVAALAASTGGSAQARTAGRAAGAIRVAAASSARNPGIRAILYQLSCKGRSFCIALGSSRRPGHTAVPLLEQWNGKQWRTVTDPLTRDLISITCGIPSFCFAARARTGRPADLVAWNGRAWHTVKAQPANPSGVTCVSPTICP